MKKLTFFAAAGIVGFVVDVGVLWLFINFKILDPFSARIIAIASAMMCTFMINRTFTFGKSHRKVSVEGARYGSVGLVSALINYLVYSGSLILLPSLSPYVALTLGSACGTAFSYMGYSRFVFAAAPQPAPTEDPR